MNKHTPGPWSAHYNNEGLTVFSPDNVTVAYVDYDECEERPVEANAHLIAAAPAMYAALKLVMEMDRTNICDEAIVCIAGALAQAEGREG